jgi:hypothetical protein
MDSGCNNAANLGKPYIIGEYASNFGQDWFNQIESKKIHPHKDDGSKLEHNDGFTVHYPEDYNQLLLISNHIRRMRGMPEVSSI